MRAVPTFAVLAFSAGMLMAEDRKATVRVEVSNAAELVLPDPHVELLDSESKKPEGGFQNSTATGIPYGTYLLWVREPGYKWFEESVVVHRPEVLIRVRLTVGKFN
jgi:hypothetical protein